MNCFFTILFGSLWGILICFPLGYTKANTNQVDSLNQLAWELRSSNRDSAFLLAERALALATKLDYDYGKSKAYSYMGLIQAKHGLYKEAKKNYYQSLAIRWRLEDSVSVARIWSNLGALEQEQGTIDSAFFYLNLAAGVFERHGVDSSLASVYDNTANAYMQLGRWELASEYFKKGLYSRQELNQQLGIANSHYNLATLYYELYDSIKIVQHASIARKGYHELGEWKGEANILNLLAAVYWETPDFLQAEKYFQEAIAVCEEHGDQSLGLIDSYRNLGGVYLEQEMTNLALNAFRKAQRLLQNKGSLNDHIDLMDYFSEAFVLQSRYDSALHYQRQMTLLQDSLYQKDKTKAVAEMEVRFEKERTENDLREERLRSQSLLQLFAGTLALALITLGFYFYRQRTNRVIAEQKSRIHEQELEDLLQTQELKMINAALEGQEVERRRIAKDLHDRLGSLLTTIKWRMDDWLEEKNDAADPNLQQTNKLLDEAYLEVRRVAHDMNSGVLAKFGLLPALKELRDTLTKNSSLEVEVVSYGMQRRLDSTYEILIYRMIQELVSNILKHAEARQVSIQVQRIEEQVQITVEDNGRGFDKDKVKTGMGLRNIEARVQGLNGSWEIDSGRGGGTSIFIDLPLGV